MNILEPINQLLGIVLRSIYGIVDNYGFSIVIFTLIVRVIMLPLTLKQQKSALEMQKVKPLMDEINKKYKNDKEKIQQETMKLYQEHGVNPMAGCLPLLIQLPILFSLYQVIIRPLTYILSRPTNEILDIFKSLKGNTGKLTDILHFSQQQVEVFGTQVDQAVASTDIGKVMNGEIIAAKANNLINFNLFGIDLSSMPRFDSAHLLTSIDILWIIPVLAAATTYLSTKMMTAATPTSDNEQAAQMQKSMSVMMPIMTLWFSFTVPLGLGLYWLANNLIQMLQQYVMNIYFLPKLKEGVESGNANKTRKNR